MPNLSHNKKNLWFCACACTKFTWLCRFHACACAKFCAQCTWNLHAMTEKKFVILHMRKICMHQYKKAILILCQNVWHYYMAQPTGHLPFHSDWYCYRYSIEEIMNRLIGKDQSVPFWSELLHNVKFLVGTFLGFAPYPLHTKSSTEHAEVQGGSQY